MESKRKYGGRWPLDADEKKSEVIKIRLRRGEVEKLKKLHKAIPFTNLSVLIRSILFKEKIPVRVANIELTKLLQELSGISNKLERLQKSKKEEIQSLKPMLETIQKEVAIINEIIGPYKTPDLLLSDLTDLEELGYYIKY